LYNLDDSHHTRAVTVWESIAAEGGVFMTLLASLSELLAFTSRGDARTRSEAAAFVDRIRSSPDVEVIDGDRGLFDAGLQLYRERLDKSYSHVDCMAMVVASARKSPRSSLATATSLAKDSRSCSNHA
jgi:predicted nucleic acid-binding protein